MSVWNAVVGAAGNLLGGAFGSSVQRKENAKNRAFQREMLANQQAFAREVNAQEMAYNDRVNAENREWNSVGAQRQRLEDAGYNPYLKDGGESVEGAAGSLAVGNASLPGNQDAPLAFADAVRNGMSSFQQAAALDESTRSSKLDNALKEYQLNKLKANDAEINPSTGKKTYFNDAAKQAADIEATRKSASVSAANAAAQDMQNAWNEAQALGENSMPLTNPDGTPMTNLQAMNKGLLSEQRSKVNEIISRAHLADSEADVNDAEALLKKYHLEVEAPVLFQSMKQSLENLKAEFRKIHADVAKSFAEMGLIVEQGKNVKIGNSFLPLEKFVDILKNSSSDNVVSLLSRLGIGLGNDLKGNFSVVDAVEKAGELAGQSVGFKPNRGSASNSGKSKKSETRKEKERHERGKMVVRAFSSGLR